MLGILEHFFDVPPRAFAFDHYSQIGIEVVGDDVLLQKLQADAPEKVSEAVQRVLRLYPSKETFIRIGHGSLIIRNRIINSLIPLEIPIEIVDETSTTHHKQSSRDEQDQNAAAAIAMLPGGRVQTTLPLEPTRGAIRHVQKQSRRLTEGTFTISESMAMEVLKGTVSLVEAIEKEKAKKKFKY